jgi:hypothetical protein
MWVTLLNIVDIPRLIPASIIQRIPATLVPASRQRVAVLIGPSPLPLMRDFTLATCAG